MNKAVESLGKHSNSKTKKKQITLSINSDEKHVVDAGQDGLVLVAFVNGQIPSGGEGLNKSCDRLLGILGLH